MVELNVKIQTLFFVSLMILWTQSLEINLLNILTDFKCKTKIKVNTTIDGCQVYAGTSLDPMYYRPSDETSTVIAYIVDETRYEEIADSNSHNIRMELADELGRHKFELIVLGIKNCQDGELDFISGFIFDIIQPDPNHIPWSIIIMGEQNFSKTYLHSGRLVTKYQENPNIFDGALQKHLNTAFPQMEYRSKRSDPSNTKEVRFYEHLERKRAGYSAEERWPVFVENGQYIPALTVINYINTMKYNFIKRYSDKKYHLLIVSGKVYDRLTSENLVWFEEIKKIMIEMKRNDEILFIMGCFNFDWSEIDAVRQIIMKHATIIKYRRNKRPKSSIVEIFNIGIGMFDTSFQNPNGNDRRRLTTTQNKKMLDFVEKLNGGKMNEKIIEICDFNASNVTTMRIRLINGRYAPLEESINYCFSNQHPNSKFAFIVMDATEMHNRNVFSVEQLNQYVAMLKDDDGIVVFVIKAYNFKLYDLHIIPEWIQWHRGAVQPDRITILGGGSFDTTFKYVSPQYEVTYTLLNVTKELKEIRKVFVNSADEKSVIIGNIDTSNFGYRKFPVHTINGFYDPVVLSTDDMFRTQGGTKILFLIMAAEKFDKMARVFPIRAPTLIADLRHKISIHYPVHQWAVYLVGLDNFREKDFHLFAEFVKIHTNDVRRLRDFVYTFGDDIYQAAYEYRDNLSFTIVNNMSMSNAFIEFFNQI